MPNVRRTLIVGLGKSGKLIAQQLKEMLQKRCGCLPYVSFFSVDLAEKPIAESLFSEEVGLSPQGMAQFVDQNPQVKARVPQGANVVYSSSSPADLTYTRLGANLLFMREAGRIQRTLDAAVRRLFDTAEWPEAIGQGFEPEQGRDVTIYVIASLCEPYGGGLLIDAAYLVQSLSSFTVDYSYSTTAVLLLFGEPPACSQANAYAALKELDYYMSHRQHENSHLRLQLDKRPFTRSCHLIDLSNEAQFTLPDNVDGLGMVSEWLQEMIFNPLETETIDIRLERMAPAEDPYPAEPSKQKIAAYSSFGYAAYSIPLPEILDYYAARFGGELLDHFILAESATQDEINAALNTFWQEEEKLEPEAVIGLKPDDVVETRISLTAKEQNEATLLFANPPQSAAEPVSPEDVPLEDLLDRIKDEMRLQRGTFFPAYSKKIQDNLDRRLVHEIRARIESKTWSLVDEMPGGGLSLAAKFLQGLAARLARTKKLLDDQKQAQDKAERDAEKNYKKAAERGNSALINAPRLITTLKYIGLILLGTLVVMGGLAFIMAREATQDVALLLQNLTIVLLVPQGFLAIAGMGTACAGKYLVDYLIGHWRAAKQEDNVPEFIPLALSIGFVPIVGAIIAWLFCQWIQDVTLPSFLQDMLLSEYQKRVLYAIVIMGVWAIGNYAFWHWLNVHEMRRLASEWCVWHDKLARHRALIRRIEVGLGFYQTAEAAVNEQLQKVNVFRSRLDQLLQTFNAKTSNLPTIYGQYAAFKKPIVEMDKVRAIYETTILNLGLEATQLFHPPRPSFSSWRQMDPDAICASVVNYIRERFREYWALHGVTQLMTPSERPSRTDLERRLGWLVEKAAKPFWPYYGTTAGTVKAFVGVGSREEETILRSAFTGLSGALGADPSFFDTADKHTVTCTVFRYGLPLHLLASLADYKRQYDAELPGNSTLHVFPEAPAELPDLFPDDHPKTVSQ